MSPSTLLLKGKYSGSTFESILAKDLNYCNFIMTLRFPTPEMKDFQDWLKVNIHDARIAFAEKESSRINRQYTVL